MKRVVVIGAGVGGLSAAALLAKAGLDVTVLEAHVCPGGCAGTFYHKGFRFEAGATLAGGFYPGGPMDRLAREVGIEHWPAYNDNPAMVVHLPDGSRINRWTDERSIQEYIHAFGPDVERFWSWQRNTADTMWDIALRMPPWPPQSIGQVIRLVTDGLLWLTDDPLKRLSSTLIADAFRPVAAHLKDLPETFRLFIDAQLLIASQTTSAYTNALYGAAALDLPRRGVVHFEGGVGAIAESLASVVRKNGGHVLYRQQVSQILLNNSCIRGVETMRGEFYPADLIIANLTPWDIKQLFGDNVPWRLRNLPEKPPSGWGAFTTYVGFDGSIISKDFPLHHQVIVRSPLGEGNSVFLSLSPTWDHKRAPKGQRALTISTHTDLRLWWNLFEKARDKYETLKQEYLKRLLDGAERILPGLREASRIVLPGTPVTFQRFTRRAWGWVGGFQQTSLFLAWPPNLMPGLWMVGDSIFPGQSIAAVALGGLRIAKEVLNQEADDDRVTHSKNLDHCMINSNKPSKFAVD